MPRLQRSRARSAASRASSARRLNAGRCSSASISARRRSKRCWSMMRSASSRAPRGPCRFAPGPGHSEQNPEDWWQALLDAVDALRAERRGRSRGRGIGLSGQMHGAVLLDDADAVLRPAILWNDVRATAECAELESAFPALRQVTGNLAMPGFTAPKLLWVRRHEPEIFARVRSAAAEGLGAPAPDRRADRGDVRRLRHALARCRRARLVGRRAGRDRPDAGTPCRALSKATRRPARCCRKWPRAGACRGRVVVGGSAATTRRARSASAAIAPGSAFVSLGTSGVLLGDDGPVHPVPAGGGARVLPRVAGHLAPDGRDAVRRGSFAWWAQVTGAAELALLAEMGAPDAPSTALFLPYLSGERTPHNDGAIRGVFAGLSHDTDRALLTQAVLEGVAFSFRDCLDALAASGTAHRRGGRDRRRLAQPRLGWDHRIGARHSVCICSPRASMAAHSARRASRRLAATGEAAEAVCTTPATARDDRAGPGARRRLRGAASPLPRPIPCSRQGAPVGGTPAHGRHPAQSRAT